MPLPANWRSVLSSSANGRRSSCRRGCRNCCALLPMEIGMIRRRRYSRSGRCTRVRRSKLVPGRPPTVCDVHRAASAWTRWRASSTPTQICLRRFPRNSRPSARWKPENPKKEKRQRSPEPFSASQSVLWTIVRFVTHF